MLRLNDTGEQSFKAFFKWVTASIKSTSVSVTDMGTDEIQLASTSGIDLERWIRLKTALWMRTLSYCSANVQIQKGISYQIRQASR